MIAKRFARIISSLAAVCIVLCMQAAAADDGAPPACRSRIGTVDLARALNAVSDGRAAKRRLKSEFKERQQRLDRLQRELQQQREEIDRERLTLSTDALGRKEESYRRKFQELRQKLIAFREDIARKEKQLTDGILQQLRAVVDRIGQEQGYDLILEASQGIVLFSQAADDLTEQLIRVYDGKGKAGGARRKGR